MNVSMFWWTLLICLCYFNNLKLLMWVLVFTIAYTCIKCMICSCMYIYTPEWCVLLEWAALIIKESSLYLWINRKVYLYLVSFMYIFCCLCMWLCSLNKFEENDEYRISYHMRIKVHWKSGLYSYFLTSFRVNPSPPWLTTQGWVIASGPINRAFLPKF